MLAKERRGLLLLKGEALTVELRASVGIQCVCPFPGQRQSWE